MRTATTRLIACMSGELFSQGRDYRRTGASCCWSVTTRTPFIWLREVATTLLHSHADREDVSGDTSQHTLHVNVNSYLPWKILFGCELRCHTTRLVTESSCSAFQALHLCKFRRADVRTHDALTVHAPPEQQQDFVANEDVLRRP